MKTINSKKQVVCGTKASLGTKSKGFAGEVSVYNSKIYVDTKDGTGYGEIIKKMEPMICMLAKKYFFIGNTIEDTKQDIVVHILEGIPKYNPDKEMKLSSFLQMRVNRRLINDLRNKSRGSRSATLLNINKYYIVCECGNAFVVTVGKGQKIKCNKCNKDISNAKKKLPLAILEVNESMLINPPGSYDSGEQTNNIYEMFPDEDLHIDEEAIHFCDIQKWLKTEDPRIIKIVELIYFHDYSISAAAKEVGLTSAGANIKLKNLQNKKIVRELFGRKNEH